MEINRLPFSLSELLVSYPKMVRQQTIRASIVIRSITCNISNNSKNLYAAKFLIQTLEYHQKRNPVSSYKHNKQF